MRKGLYAWLSLAVLVTALPKVARAGGDSSQFKLEIRQGLNDFAGEWHPTVRITYCLSDKPGLINTVSLEANDIKMRGDWYQLILGHRKTRDRAGIEIGAGIGLVRNAGTEQCYWATGDKWHTRGVLQVGGDYALTNRLALTGSYQWGDRTLHGSGPQVALAYRPIK